MRILLRALLNAMAALVAMMLFSAGIPKLLLEFQLAIPWHLPVVWSLGLISSALVLFHMSKLQRITLDLTVGELVVQNLVSIGFLSLCLNPVPS